MTETPVALVKWIAQSPAEEGAVCTSAVIGSLFLGLFACSATHVESLAWTAGIMKTWR
jgi:hypothetical protein